MMLFSLLGVILFLYFLPKQRILYSSLGSLVIVIFGIASIIYFVSNYFTGNGLDHAVIYHIFYGIEGTGVEGDKEMIYKAIGIGIFTLIIAIIYALWSYKTKIRVKGGYLHIILVFFCIVYFHPLTENIYNLYLKEFNVEFALNKEKNYTKYSFSGSNFKENYISKPENKSKKKVKNLVYIYLESYEQLYLDEILFPGLSNNLNILKEEAQVFTNIHQVFGTNWTIAGMVGSQCGIPLVGSLENTDGQFLGKAYCMSDLLKEQGYHLSYIGGADLKFAQKGNFYSTHSFDTILGNQELTNDINDSKYVHDWGLYDDTTFERVFEEFKTLSQQETPFALFTISLDTHGDEGTLSKSCKDIKYSQEHSILNSYKCTDRLIGDLVKRIQSSEYYENTLIVISSDHYAMNHNNSVSLLKQQESDRRNLFMILNDNSPTHTHTRTGTILDISPTVLTSLGIEIQALGLGRNLFNNQIKNLGESYSDTYSVLSSWRSDIKKLW